MKYKLPDIQNIEKFGKIFIGKKDRWATATAVDFVDNNTILVGSFLDKKIYLIDITNNTPKIVDTINTNYYVDLLSYKDGIIATAGRNPHESQGVGEIYKLENNKITFVKSHENSIFKQLHGVRIIADDYVLYTNTDKNLQGLKLYNISKNQLIDVKVNIEGNPKDIFLVNEDKLLIASSTARPDPKPTQGGSKTILYLFNYPTMEKIDQIEFNGQSDCIVYENGIGFVTLQDRDSLQHFNVNINMRSNPLVDLGEIKKDFTFPHGATIRNGKVIVTNYGDNSISIYNLNEII